MDGRDATVASIFTPGTLMACFSLNSDIEDALTPANRTTAEKNTSCLRFIRGTIVDFKSLESGKSLDEVSKQQICIVKLDTKLNYAH
jgi:hypothetical protein